MRNSRCLFALILLCCSCSHSQDARPDILSSIDGCRAFVHHGDRRNAQLCFTRLSQSSTPFERAEGFWGLEDYDSANQSFRQAAQSPVNTAVIKTEWGKLFAERFNEAEAGKLFQEALTADQNYAPAYLEFARVLSAGFDKRAPELAQEALRHDPKLAEAHALLAYLALEDSDARLATEEAQKALALSPESLDALTVLASEDWVRGNTQSPSLDRILKINPLYGQVYATGAHFLNINYRYTESIAFDRKALAIDDRLWGARSDLGINLMRVGSSDEAKKELAACYEAHFRNAQTVNALRLLDSLEHYELSTSGKTQILTSKSETALLLPYVQKVLDEAIATYERKYQMHLPGPIRVELYPNREDFEVHTLGLPGQGGLLGVTFGTVVAMNSPSARPAGEFKWADTLWHELSHVYVVTATHELVPRWFTEGLAVHEEGAARQEWGDRLTPDIIAALKAKKLLSVLALDKGFVRQDYPNQVLVSYYQAGKILDFIATKWGDAAILGMIHSYANRKTTAEALQVNLHVDADDFDGQFQAWLQTKTGTVVDGFDRWKAGLQSAASDLQAGKRQDAFERLKQLEGIYPDYVGHDSAYQLLASYYTSVKDPKNTAEQLERYRNAGGTDIATLKQLSKLEEDNGSRNQSETTLRTIISVFPEDADVHASLGNLLLADKQADSAVDEFKAVLATKPADTAQSHFNLARALQAAHHTNEAKDQVLVALEAAPDFKPAQQLLLQLSQ